MTDKVEQPQSTVRLIQVRELRQRLGGVSAMWVHRHEDELPPSQKIAGRRFWLEADIDKYISGLFASRLAA